MANRKKQFKVIIDDQEIWYDRKEGQIKVKNRITKKVSVATRRTHDNDYRDQQILYTYRYTDKTQYEIAEEFGLTQGRVAQILREFGYSTPCTCSVERNKKIVELYRGGMYQSDIAAMFNLTKGRISQIVNSV